MTVSALQVCFFQLPLSFPFVWINQHSLIQPSVTIYKVKTLTLKILVLAIWCIMLIKSNYMKIRCCCFFFFKDFIYLFGKGRRTINVWLPFMCPLLGTWPTTQASALTRNQTCNLPVHRLALNPLNHTSQAVLTYFLKLYSNHYLEHSNLKAQPSVCY